MPRGLSGEVAIQSGKRRGEGHGKNPSTRMHQPGAVKGKGGGGGAEAV